MEMTGKEKVIVWGLGKNYLRFRNIIEDKFNVIGYTDIKFKRGDQICPKGILTSDIMQFDYDKILVTVSNYYDAIRMQLIQYGVPADKIIGLGSVLQCFDESERVREIAHEMELYKELNSEANFSIDNTNLKIITADKYMSAGLPPAHYFAQDIWGAQKIYKNHPEMHYDIGSRLDGFISHLLVFREVYYIDIRPLPYNIPNLHFIQGNAEQLGQLEDNSIESLSSFHAIEHFGLGRYGDKIDPVAYKKVAESIQRVMKKDGRVYIGVPIGPQDKLIFNAHRIFSIKTVIGLFHDMALQDIAIVRGSDTYVETIEKDKYECVDEYSCGLFEFIKK